MALAAWEEREQGGDMGARGGQYLEEIPTRREGEGIATAVLRAARQGCAGRDFELQVNDANERARGWYELLGLHGTTSCGWVWK